MRYIPPYTDADVTAFTDARFVDAKYSTCRMTRDVQRSYAMICREIEEKGEGVTNCWTCSSLPSH